jgi:hypothetical protein
MRNKPVSKSDPWRSGTWDGARLEQLRRWMKLPLRKKLQAVEAMGQLVDRHGKKRSLAKSARKT